MKTRQEMIYDFMLALASNGAIFDCWNDVDVEYEMGGYGEHLQALASELTDQVLGSQ